MKSSPKTLPRLTTFFLLVSWTCFTFYSAIVVPIGTELFDPIHQGLITQRVTHWLNLLTGIYVVLHLAEMMMIPTRIWQKVAWAVILLSLVGLVALHPYLDNMIDLETMDVTGGREFYQGHRAYLWVNTVGWLASGWLFVVRYFRSI